MRQDKQGYVCVSSAAVPEPMKLRNVRMPDQLWRDLMDLAAAEDERTADLVRDVLQRHVARRRKVIEDYRAGNHAATPASVDEAAK